MRAVVDEQIPGIGNQRARSESAACDQIDQRETNPYLPKNCEDRVVGIGMMEPMFVWCEAMQHKAMHEIFRKGQRNDTTGEKHSVRTYSELRNCQQDDSEQGRYQHFAEIDDGGHEPSLRLDCLPRNALLNAAGVNRWPPEYRQVPAFLPYTPEIRKWPRLEAIRLNDPSRDDGDDDGDGGG